MESRIATFENCIECGRTIPSAFQLEHPGTDVCDYCAAVTVNVDIDEEEH